MGMLLTQTFFAEHIIEKYCSLETYDLENQTLVFYREGAEQGGKASSSYNTELTLKLVFMMKHLEQSGQKLSLNWNLLSRTLLKQVSAEIQKSPWMGSIQLQQKKLVLSEIRRQQLQPGHMKQFLKLLTEKENQQLVSELTNLVQIPEIREQIKSLTTSRLKERTSRILYGLLSGKVHIHGVNQEFLHIQDLYRKYEERMFRETEKETVKSQLLQEEERIWWGTMETVLDVLAIRPEQAKKAGRELAELLKTVDLSTVINHETLREEMKASWKTLWTEEYHLEQTSERLVHILREEPEKLKILQNLLRYGSSSLKEQLKGWMKKQVTETWQENLEALSEKLTRTEVIQRQLVYQVRTRMGNDAADRLEQYFSRREQVTNQVVIGESAFQMEEQIKNILDSYFSVLRGETMAAEMGPERELLLKNQVQEKVHMPMERSVQENRRSLEHVMRLVTAGSSYRYSQNRLSRNIRRYFEETAVNRLRIYQSSRGVQTPFHGSSMVLQTQAVEAYSQPEWFDQVQQQVFRRQTYQEEQLNETKNIVKELNEKIEIQEKLVAELKKKTGQPGLPPEVNISRLTGEVMKRMERDLRLEKMRRGLL